MLSPSPPHLQSTNTMNPKLNDILTQAETYWKESRCQEALSQYDLALTLTLDNESKHGEILLGRGYAILNSKDPIVVDDQKLRMEAVNNLKQAKAISIKQGNTRAADFVQTIIDQKGKLHLPSEKDGHGHGHGHNGEGCCSSSTNQNEDGSAAKDCGTHDAVAKSVATRASLYAEGKDVGIWTEDADEHLISLVAKLGVIGSWEEISIALKSTGEVGEELISISVLKSRWNYLKPYVKEEFENGNGEEKARKCGHSCGTCPTRVTCKLHEAVDIEDIIAEN